LEGRELAYADPRPPLDREQEGGLPAGDAERMNLSPQVAVELQENRPEPVRDGDGIGGGGGGECCHKPLTKLTVTAAADLSQADPRLRRGAYLWESSGSRSTETIVSGLMYLPPKKGHSPSSFVRSATTA